MITLCKAHLNRCLKPKENCFQRSDLMNTAQKESQSIALIYHNLKIDSNVFST